MLRNRQYVTFFVFLFLSVSPILWAAEAPVVHLTTTVRAPYSGPSLPGKGYITEITSAALQRVGYRLKVTYMPWSRAVRTAALGGSDGVMGVLYNENRTRHLSYTEPLVPVRIVLLKRKGVYLNFRELSDLNAYRIAFVRGGATNIDFGLEVQIEESLNHGHALQQLVAGRVDLMMDTQAVITYLLKSGYPKFQDQVEIVRPALSVHHLFIAFSRSVEGYERRLSDFNRGLKLIREDGTYQRIRARHGFRQPAEAAAP